MITLSLIMLQIECNTMKRYKRVYVYGSPTAWTIIASSAFGVGVWSALCIWELAWVIYMACDRICQIRLDEEILEHQ